MRRSVKPRKVGGALEAFQLEELLMLSASPVAAAVVDPSLTADADGTNSASTASPMVVETAESTMQVADVPQDGSDAEGGDDTVPGDAGSNLLQQFGLAESADQSQQNLELVFIDEATDNYQQLIEDLMNQGDDQHQIEIILLDSEQDGILQISEALEDYGEVDAVHFVSHGTEQSVKLGSTWLSMDNLDQYLDEITGWKDSFTAETDLLFYGCNLAENNSGQELLRNIQSLTGTDIAASSDDTGAASLGGDWDLEYELGSLETQVIFSSMLQDDWLGLLATETVRDQFGTQSYGNNDGTVNWNGNWVEYDNSGSSQSASTGDVRITGGELRMVGDSGVDNSVTRELDLSAAHDATLSFDASSSGTEAGDTFSVQISEDGGGSWTVLDTLTDYSGSYSKDISSYLSTDTQIRIQIDSGYDGGLLGLLFVEYLYIDNVQVSYTVNEPPAITSDGGGAAAVVNVAENTTDVTAVTATDANLDSLNYAITGGADAGRFSIDNSTGDLAFRVAPDYESPTDNNADNIYEVIVEASDGFGGTDSQTMLVTVTPVNEAPGANDNTVTTSEDAPYTFSAADFNFSDIDGDTLASVKITALESVGALQLSGVDVTLNQVISRADIDAGNLRFMPVANASGTSYDSFGFVVGDGGLESSPSNTMTINVTAVNDAPTATDNTVSTSEDTPYTFSAADFNFSDIEGDALASVKITALEMVGALQLSGADVTLNQVVSRADIDAGNLTFTPVANANGTSYDSFGFSVNDGTTDSAASYTLTVDVTAVNDLPTAANNTVTTSEDTSYTFMVADFNFSDVDGDTLFSVKIDSLETAGALQLSGVDVALNQVIDRADIDAGNLTFTPVANASGTSYDSFGFSVNDGTADSAVNYTLTVDVTAVNDVPTAADNTVTTMENTTYTFTASDFGFSDLDGDTLASVQITTLEAVGALQLSGVDVTLNQVISKGDLDAGNLTFTPVADTSGAAYDSFGFTVNDGTADSVAANTMTVDVTPDPGSMILDQFGVQSYSNNDGTVNWRNDWVENDSSGSAQSPANGDVRITGGELRMVGESGADNSVTREADLSMAQDATLSFSAVSSGTESNDSFSVQISDDGGGAWTVLDVLTDFTGNYSRDISAWTSADTQVRIQIDTGYDGGLLGLLFVEYLYVDDVQISYTVNNPPVITSDGGGPAAVLNVAENTTAVTTVAASDADLDPLNYAITGGTDAGLFAIDNSTGALAFINPPDFESPGDSNADDIYEVMVAASDGFGGSDAQTMLITVTPVNEPPRAADNTVTTSEETPYIFTAANFNFSDDVGDSLASIKITSLETVGTLQLSGADVTLNQVIDRTDIDAGNLMFTPVANASGTSYDSFGFSVNDGTADSTVSYTMTMDVTPVNDAPTASDSTVTTSEDVPYVFTAADFNFTDVDGDALASVRITSLETVGALQLSGVDVTLNQVVSRGDIDAGNLTFTPVANASGAGYASFGFSVNDGALDSTPANTMTIDVTAVNDAPTAADNTVTTSEDTTYIFNAADFGFGDVDGDLLTSLRITSLPTAGALQLSGVDVTLNQSISRADLDAGNLTFSPAADANGAGYASFDFTVSDGSLDSSPAHTLTVDVTPVNDAPTSTDNTVTTSEDTPYVFTAADFNFSDIDGDALASVTMTMLPTVGALQLSGADVTFNQVISRADIDAGNLMFVPQPNGNGLSYDSFGFMVSDGSLEAAVPSVITVDVTPVNDVPVITSSGGGLTATLHLSGVLSTVATIEATDVELGIQVLTFSINGGLDAGQFTIDASTGVLSFAATADINSPLGGNLNDIYEVEVQVSDDLGGTATQLLTVIVDQVNQIFPSEQQTPDDPGNADDSDQPDQTDDNSDSGQHSDQGNEDIVFTTLPSTEPGLFSQTMNSPAQRDGGVQLASVSNLELNQGRSQLLDTSFARPDDIIYTDFGYEGGGWQTARTVQPLAPPAPLQQTLEIRQVEVVYTELVSTRYEEIQEQVSLTEEQQQRFISTATVVTTTVTSGLLIWALQGGYLMAGLASSLPTWRFMDLIVVLDEFGEDSEDDGDSLQSLIEQAESRTAEQSDISDESEIV